MSTPVAPGLLAFPQLSTEEKENDASHIPEPMRAEGSQRRATSRQGVRPETDGARHDALSNKSSRESEASNTIGKSRDDSTKSRKKKAAVVAERFGAAERFGFSSRFGIDPTQYKQHHVAELGNVGRDRERDEVPSALGRDWGGHGLREVARSKPPVHVAK